MIGGRDDFFPSNPRDLGKRMRELRGRRITLRELEERARKAGRPVSRPSLSRYERGVALPPLGLAEVMDDLYDAKGYLRIAITRLWFSAWDPWEQEEWSARQHNHEWPALYQGDVWIALRPAHAEPGQPTRIELDWGPWSRSLTTELPDSGVLLVTGKARDRDGISRTLNLSCSSRVFVLFGAGDAPETGRTVNIRRGWVLREPPGSEMEHGPLVDA